MTTPPFQARSIPNWVIRRSLFLPVEYPRIVCLCGSAKFWEHFQKVNQEETLKGNIVLSIGFFPGVTKQRMLISACQGDQEVIVSTLGKMEHGCTPEQKEQLDSLHLRKIDLADEVLVLNVGGYIGESTRTEIDYAMKMGVPVRYLEPTTIIERVK